MHLRGEYYDRAREALLDLFPSPPHTLLDIGCGAGAFGVAAQARWPGVRTIGVEVVADAAALAATRLDRVIAASAETLDFAAHAVRDIDGVLLADVLEHLVDPWAFLERLRGALAPGAFVVASIPNAANLWLIEELAQGRFEYADAGLLDRTHLRFFTRSSIARMFADAGYEIGRWERTTDGRVDDLTRHRVLGIMLPPHAAGTIRGQRVSVHRADAAAYEDLRTVQFLLLASPRQAA